MNGIEFGNDEEIVAAFVEESKEHLIELENGILWLERNGLPKRDVAGTPVPDMFRSTHSIKAGAALFRLEKIEKIAHAVENVLQNIRQCEIEIDMERANALLQGKDRMDKMLESPFESNDIDISPLLERLSEFSH